MAQKIQVRFTGKKGKVDGYVETLLGTLMITGQLLKQPKFNKRYRDNDIVQIYVNLELQDPPLGNLGENDITETPFNDGEFE